jgi:hypothetical protein
MRRKFNPVLVTGFADLLDWLDARKMSRRSQRKSVNVWKDYSNLSMSQVFLVENSI